MDDQQFAVEIAALLASGQKIEAVKRYRERHAVSLAEAKQAVEALELTASEPPSAPAEVAQNFTAQIVEFLGRGQFIEAVKHYREQTGAGLKASKAAVERIAAQHQLPTGSGCLGAVVLLVILGVACGC